MKKKNVLTIIRACVLTLILIVTVFASGCTSADNKETSAITTATPTVSEIPIETEPTLPEEEIIILENVIIERIEPTTLDEANKALENAIDRKDMFVEIHKNLLLLGYMKDHPAVKLIETDIKNCEKDVEYYTEQQALRQEEYNWQVRAEEYPAATEAWLYMKNEFGWNDIVCAGIIGNLMAECGGCWTQDLDWTINTKHGMGMAQWLSGRRSQLIANYGENPSLVDQLNFMRDELYGINGATKQVTDNQLDKIMNAETPEDCAFAFATYYERCAEKYRYPRKGYARTAYEYFVD